MSDTESTQRSDTATESTSETEVPHCAVIHTAAIVDSSDDAIMAATLDGKITIWNRSCQQLFGYAAAEIIGNNSAVLIPSGQHNAFDRAIEMLATVGHCPPFESVRQCKDGKLVDVQIRLSPIRDESGALVGTSQTILDVSAMKQEQLEVQAQQDASDRRLVVLETAGRVALDILSSRTGVEALRHIADAARTLAHARYAALGVARQDGAGLLEFAAVGFSAEEETQIGSRPKGTGILGLLLNRHEPLRIDRLSEHPASVGFPANHPSMTSFLGVPIRRGSTVLGSLYLTDKLDGKSFTMEDEIAVQAIGAYAAVAIHNLHMITRQRALVSGLIAAQEEERRAVAYDLHDGLTQFVMASHAHMESFKRAHAAGNNPEKAEREINQALKYLKEAVIESRRMVNGLRSLALDDLGLAGALEQLLAEEKGRSNWDAADLIHNIPDRRFDPTLETAVYRVAQEAVTNVRKHAQSPRVRVSLILSLDESLAMHNLSLEIRDWGSGFVPEQKVEDYAHFGLHGMTERVQLLGGEYRLHSAPGSGTTVRARFPVPDHV